jgi:homospermidine synthase
LLAPLLGEGDFLLNLASSVSSRSLLELAQRAGPLYLDTGIEPWSYVTPLTGVRISNHALREEILAMKRHSALHTTAIVAYGANPGFASILVKKAMISLASTCPSGSWDGVVPASRLQWAELASMLDLRVIQISEYDTQRQAAARHASEFVNTWSVPGFIEECLQNAEMGWGTHEHKLPHAARQHTQGSRSSIVLAQRGCDTRVKSWSPLQGEFEACLFTHNESLSLADYLTLGDPGNPIYRPTVYYAYRPADATVAAMDRLRRHGRTAFTAERVLKDEVADGIDELGVLLMTGSGRAMWFGSALSVHRARSLAPYNNATSLQVASSIVGAMRWALAHPCSGIVESEDMDPTELFDHTRHYWDPLSEVFTEWLPATASTGLQFGDFLVDNETVSLHESGVTCADN